MDAATGDVGYLHQVRVTMKIDGQEDFLYQHPDLQYPVIVSCDALSSVVYRVFGPYGVSLVEFGNSGTLDVTIGQVVGAQELNRHIDRLLSRFAEQTGPRR